MSLITHTLTNPGAESGDTTGWSDETGGLAVRSASPSPYSGSYYFYGGANLETKSSQEVDLVSDGVSTTEIDNGDLIFEVDWWQASYAASDQADIRVRFKNAAKATISEAGLGLWSVGEAQYWYPRRYAPAMPANTRYADVVLHFYRTAGTNNDGYIDAVTCRSRTRSPTTYTTDFSEYSLGAPGDWTERWDTGTAAATIVSADGGKALQIAQSSDDTKYAVSWDDLGNTNYVDFRAKFRQVGSFYDYGSRLFICGSGRTGGIATAPNAYFFDIIDGGSHIAKYVAGASPGVTVGSNISKSFNADTWYWFRFQYQGGNVKAKVWNSGQSEPASWSVSTTATDSDKVSLGWVGVGNNTAASEHVTCQYKNIEIAVDGELGVSVYDDSKLAQPQICIMT